RREPQLALALARSGRPGEAAPLLRKWAGRTTDPEARDKLAYHLALVELSLGHERDADKILRLLSSAGTQYGLIARAHVRGRELDALQRQSMNTPPEEGATP